MTRRTNHGPALWIGDRVSGYNRYTDENIYGTLAELGEGSDGRVYATVTTHDGEAVIEARLLRGPAKCYRPSDGGDYTKNDCVNCGRKLYNAGPHAPGEALTHRPDSVASRYR